MTSASPQLPSRRLHIGPLTTISSSKRHRSSIKRGRPMLLHRAKRAYLDTSKWGSRHLSEEDPVTSDEEENLSDWNRTWVPINETVKAAKFEGRGECEHGEEVKFVEEARNKRRRVEEVLIGIPMRHRVFTGRIVAGPKISTKQREEVELIGLGGDEEELWGAPPTLEEGVDAEDAILPIQEKQVSLEDTLLPTPTPNQKNSTVPPEQDGDTSTTLSNDTYADFAKVTVKGASTGSTSSNSGNAGSSSSASSSSDEDESVGDASSPFDEKEKAAPNNGAGASGGSGGQGDDSSDEDDEDSDDTSSSESDESESEDEDEDMEKESGGNPGPVKVSTLKDMFAAEQSTQTGFSLLSGLDVELDTEMKPIGLAAPAPPRAYQEVVPEPLPVLAPLNQTISSFNPDSSIPLFFPVPRMAEASGTRGRGAPSLLDEMHEEGFKGFWRQETDEQMSEAWNKDKLELTREYKKRHREAVKRRKRGRMDLLDDE